MDRGYVDFARLHVLHLAGAFFVTRAKSNMDAHRVYSAPTDRTTGIICDQTIALDGHYTSQHYPEHLRRIRFRDTGAAKTLVFLTNQFGLPATTICALYKSRRQVELFFKWIKQHLRVKRFFGTSENAVKTQIWIAVSVYVLVAIVKKRLALDASLYTLLQILSVTLFEKIPIHQALTQDDSKSDTSQINNQWNLFAYWPDSSDTSCIPIEGDYPGVDTIPLVVVLPQEWQSDNSSADQTPSFGRAQRQPTRRRPNPRHCTHRLLGWASRAWLSRLDSR
jgi:hypothetical protein